MATDITSNTISKKPQKPKRAQVLHPHLRQLVLLVEYDGTELHGSQRQPGARSVQAELETALKTMTGEEYSFLQASRTDAGVHARGQIFAVRTRDGRSCEDLRRNFNHYLPADVVVVAACWSEIEPREDSVGKYYVYTIHTGPKRALGRQYAWQTGELDVEAMRTAAASLTGAHDFTSFGNARPKSGIAAGRSPLCDLRVLAISESRGALEVHLVADQFLHNMVRIIVGTLVEVGKGRRTIDNLLEARDRKQAGPAAPALGLCLAEVLYLKQGAARPGSQVILNGEEIDRRTLEEVDAIGGERNLGSRRGFGDALERWWTSNSDQF